VAHLDPAAEGIEMRSRKAFTLLEILIASTLLSTLMLVLWSLFHTYTRLEERSSRTAVELQLIRSVSKQLRSDIEHFAMLAEMPEIVPQENDDSSQQNDSNDESSSSEETSTDAEQSNDDSSNVDDSPIDESPSEDYSEVTSGSVGAIVPTVQIDLGEISPLDPGQLQTGQEFSSSLLEQTYIRGSATKLELITRMPYTVEVPTGNALLGAETRCGTHQWVVYEWRDVRDLNSLLQNDPILNPSRFVPPPPDPLRDPRLPAVAPPVATRLNPNDNVGLIRESKSWLLITRDQRREALRKQAEAAGLLNDGQLAWELQPIVPEATRIQESLLERDRSAAGQFDGQAMQPVWAPPPELRHKRDHIPEVTKLQFRYFDGESWRLEWTDSESLPRAIEVAFDLDPNAPALRAKEFEDAHAAMIGGASLTEVLPPKDELLDKELEDPFALLNLEDPTAIVTEYRFVIGVPQGAKKEQDRREELSESDSAEELSFSLEENR